MAFKAVDRKCSIAKLADDATVALIQRQACRPQRIVARVQRKRAQFINSFVPQRRDLPRGFVEEWTASLQWTKP
jgi:hypothetical protein